MGVTIFLAASLLHPSLSIESIDIYIYTFNSRAVFHQQLQRKFPSDRGPPTPAQQPLPPRLAWIREMAPIIVHVDLSKMLKFMEEDTHYRNQLLVVVSSRLQDGSMVTTSISCEYVGIHKPL